MTKREAVLGERGEGERAPNRLRVPCGGVVWFGEGVVKRACRAAKRRRAEKPRSRLAQEGSAMSEFGEGGR